jgi:hypothetical protein
MGGWVGPRADLDTMEKRQIFSARNQTPAIQPVACSFIWIQTLTSLKEGEIPQKRPKHRQKNNIKMGTREHGMKVSTERKWLRIGSNRGFCGHYDKRSSSRKADNV